MMNNRMTLFAAVLTFALPVLAAPASSYEERLQGLIEQELSGSTQTITQDVYGKGAAMRIIAGVDLDEANAVMKSVASWFDRPHPRGIIFLFALSMGSRG